MVIKLEELGYAEFIDDWNIQCEFDTLWQELTI